MLFRLLRSIYPLLKDVLLEGKSIREATKNKKGRLLILMGVILSLSLNYILIPRAFTLSARIVKLEKELKQAKDGYYNSPVDDFIKRRDYYLNYFDDLN